MGSSSNSHKGTLPFLCGTPFFFDSSGNGGKRGSEIQVARFIDDTSGSHPTSLPLRPLFFPAQNGTQRSPQPLSGFQFLLGKPQVFSEVIFAVSPDIKQFFFFLLLLLGHELSSWPRGTSCHIFFRTTMSSYSPNLSKE